MMKVESSTRTIVAILVVVACAVAFWMLLLSPKRKEADELSTQAEGLRSALSVAQSKVAEGEAAKKNFAKNYQQLVVLGKAVPKGEETASLLVQTNRISSSSKVKFETIELGTADGSASTGTEVSAESASAAPTATSATEAEASLLPIGASIGRAGLGIMPYDLTFTGSFFHVADFIHGIDSLVTTKDEEVSVDGRLVTLDGFSLTGDANKGFPYLDADFSVTTYVIPPTQTITAGATSTEPAAVEGEEAPPAEEAESTEGTPSSASVEPK